MEYLVIVIAIVLFFIVPELMIFAGVIVAVFYFWKISIFIALGILAIYILYKVIVFVYEDAKYFKSEDIYLYEKEDKIKDKFIMKISKKSMDELDEWFNPKIK
jgi:hypothetical protein